MSMREKLQVIARSSGSLFGVKPRFLSLLLATLAVAAVALLTLGNREHGVPTPVGAPSSASAADTPMPPTRLLAASSATIVNATQPLRITLSAPVAPTTPPPTIIPAVAGSWSIVGDSEVFTPVSTLEPCTGYALTVWARTDSTGHAQLGRRHAIHLNVACPPLAGLQQALARLGYLGASFRPYYDVHYAPGRETRREAAEHVYHPPRGVLAPDPTDAPPTKLGQLDATTRGALEIYQADNGLEATGAPDRSTWLSVLYDLTVAKRDPHPYTWVSVSEALPETLELHQGHRVVFTTPANTGVPGAETEQGIFPIYERFVSTTMAGEDVDGTKYDVPDVPWVNYFNGGDAVHGYPRESYGFPQSNGCVELPIEAAQHIYPMLAVGDIVWVR
jgi:peptidoglycan hydrolase-like protein with peptidoglycan-binding domain